MAQARNPYRTKPGEPPTFLAGRAAELAEFERYLEDYPARSHNIRVTGLRGVGKTVLAGEFKSKALERGWVVVERDFNSKLESEGVFETAFAEDLEEAVLRLSVFARAKKAGATALTAVRSIFTAEFHGVTWSAGGTPPKPRGSIERRMIRGLAEVGELAKRAGRPVLFVYDEAHLLRDRKARHQAPLHALLEAFIKAEAKGYPLMLLLVGLPSLRANVHSARPNSERFFRTMHLENLSLEAPSKTELSPAVLALTKPVERTGISYAPDAAETIVKDVAGYPYFIQRYGDALWDQARLTDTKVIDEKLYSEISESVRRVLDKEFYEDRFEEANRSDRLALSAAGSLGGEEFSLKELAELLASEKKSYNAVTQSVNRLVEADLLYRTGHGELSYTAPGFGDFLRRKAPFRPSTPTRTTRRR